MLEENYNLNITQKLTKEYCLFRYKQEKEFKSFKNTFDLEMKDLIQDIIEHGISKRNIDNHRTAFEKLLTTSDYNSPDNIEKLPSEKAEIIFHMMLQSITDSKSNNMFAYKDRYIIACDLIQKYFTRYFEIKNTLSNFKSKQSEALSKLSNNIKEEGIPLFIVKYVYKRMKTDLSVINISPTEFSYSEDLYNSLKDELLNGVKNV